MHHAASAYGRTARMGLSVRDLEAQLLSQQAAALEQASKPGAEPRALADAIAANCRLWFALVEGASANTDVPESIRANTVRLGRFVMARSRAVVETGDASAVQPLVSVNRELAAGLRGSVPD